MTGMLYRATEPGTRLKATNGTAFPKPTHARAADAIHREILKNRANENSKATAENT